MKFDPSLYLVVGQEFTNGRNLAELVAEAVAGGVTMVQLREKRANLREFTELARALKSALAPSGVPLIINDSVEIAQCIGAQGVHIGQSDMPYAQARRILGPAAYIGLSVETIDQAQEAEALDVDYLGISPVFASASKQDTGTPWGLEGLSQLREHSKHCLVAIGGITTENAGRVIRAGAHGIAVVSAICSAPEPRRAAATLRDALRA